MTAAACPNCTAWKGEVDRVQGVLRAWRTEAGEPFTAEQIVEWLKHHRATHADWASWFEAHPDDPRAKVIGDAKFHRDVERRYDSLIAGVRSLASASDGNCEAAGP